MRGRAVDAVDIVRHAIPVSGDNLHASVDQRGHIFYCGTLPENFFGVLWIE